MPLHQGVCFLSSGNEGSKRMKADWGLLLISRFRSVLKCKSLLEERRKGISGKETSMDVGMVYWKGDGSRAD